MINTKIKADLLLRGKSAPETENKILTALEAAPDQVFTLRELCSSNGRHSGSFWAAAYNLAAKGMIGYADRKYHVWGASVLARYNQRVRSAVWHKSMTIEDIVVREGWVDMVPRQVQAPLFGGDVGELSNDDLEGLLQRVQQERFERALKARYVGGDVNTCAPIVEALRGLGIADPVAYMHSDQNCTFVTMTSTKEMPIKVTLKGKGKEARTIEDVEHITLHGLPVVATLKSAFEGGDQ